jgi:hypothetical protein
MSFLSAIGKLPKEIFGFLASNKGKAVVAGVETLAEDVSPTITPIINLVNSWMGKIMTVEALAESAGQASGSGTQKAAVVIGAIAPELESDFPTLSAGGQKTINDALTLILNTLNPSTTVKATPAA